MEMKKAILTAWIALSANSIAFAHDGGHGPQLTKDAGRRGGVLTAVVAKSDANQGEKAALVHKAELVRSDDKIYVYIYDAEMKPLDLKAFGASASASLLTSSKDKKGKATWKNADFSLELKDGAFVGKMPKPESKPFNIDVTFKEGDRDLLSAFDNLR